MNPLRYPESPVFYRDLERTYRSAVRASGVWIETADGSRWLDGCGGALTISIGHGRQEVVQAATRQLEDVAYVHGAQFTTDAMEEAAAALVAALPAGFRDAKVYLTPGGTEAVETAMKLARAYALAAGHPERSRIVSQRPGYHGNTLGALSVSGRDALREPYLPLLAEMPLVAAPWCPRCPLGLRYPACEVACAREVDRALDEAEGDVAAVLVEPVLGASAGGFAPPEDYLRAVRRCTRDRGLLLIADEVLSGCGRTGRFLAAAVVVVALVERLQQVRPGGQDLVVDGDGGAEPAEAPGFRPGETEHGDDLREVGVEIQLLPVAIRAGIGIVGTEVHHVAEPIAQHALRDAHAHVGADPPVDDADLVDGESVDGESAQVHEAAAMLNLVEPAGDVPGDLGHLEVAPLDVVEPQSRGPDVLQRALECLHVPGTQVDGEVVPGGKVAAAPCAGVADRGTADFRHRIQSRVVIHLAWPV